MLKIGSVRNKIIEMLDQRNRTGLEKYGVTIDEGDPPTGSWRQEVIDELIDALQYAVRQLLEAEKELAMVNECVDNLEGMVYDRGTEISSLKSKIKANSSILCLDCGAPMECHCPNMC